MAQVVVLTEEEERAAAFLKRVPPSLLPCTLVRGSRRSLILKLSDTRVYEPLMRARLVITAHFCEVVLKVRTVHDSHYQSTLDAVYVSSVFSPCCIRDIRLLSMLYTYYPSPLDVFYVVTVYSRCCTRSISLLSMLHRYM